MGPFVVSALKLGTVWPRRMLIDSLEIVLYICQFAICTRLKHSCLLHEASEAAITFIPTLGEAHFTRNRLRETAEERDTAQDTESKRDQLKRVRSNYSCWKLEFKSLH